MHQNVIITGPTGVGKSYIACALGNAACRQGFSTRYYRVPLLVQELALAQGDGSYSRFLGRIAKVELLTLDDWGLTKFTESAGSDFLGVVEDRYQLRSTIIARQLTVENWRGSLSDPTVADAILDRLAYSAHKITLKSESMRKVFSADLNQSVHSDI